MKKPNKKTITVPIDYTPSPSFPVTVTRRKSSTAPGAPRPQG